MILISSWSLFQVQSYLTLGIINYGISKHYAGSQVSDRHPLGYLFLFTPTFPYFFMKMPYYPYFFTLKCHLHVKIQKFFLSHSDFISSPKYIFWEHAAKYLNFLFLPQKSVCSACTIVTVINVLSCLFL